MVIEDGGVISIDLVGVVEDDDLGIERGGVYGGVVFGVIGNVVMVDFFDGDVFYVEINVVIGNIFSELFVVYFDGFDFSGDVGRSEGNDYIGFEDISFDMVDRDCVDIVDFVDILEGKMEGFVGGMFGGFDGVDGFKEGFVGGFVIFDFFFLVFVLGVVGGSFKYVVVVEIGDGDEGNSFGVVVDFFDEVGGFFDDFVEVGFGLFGGVYFVDGDDELFYIEGVGEESVFMGLVIFGDISFEFISIGGNDENGVIGLGSISNYVFDEIMMVGGIWRSKYVSVM